MYVIVGLGNPEPEYAQTRHNMGFDTINKIAQTYHIEMSKTKFNAIYGSGTIQHQKVVLVKPQTYMNLSGQAVREFTNFYKIALEELILIYDDIDIEKGIVKLRKKGGPGTHNGMKSVVQELGNQEFSRVRVGIGSPEFKNDMVNYVIGKIPKEEKEILQQGVEKATLAIEEILKNGMDTAMNRYN